MDRTTVVSYLKHLRDRNTSIHSFEREVLKDEIKELERTAQEVPVQEQYKEYMISINEDGTETKELIKKIDFSNTPTIEETFKEYRKKKKKITILCLLLYIVIITLIMYLSFKFY